MPATSDIAYTFDPRSIISGVDKVNKKMTSMTQGFAKAAGNMTKNISRGIMSAVTKVGLLFAAFKGVQGLLKEMPEIGQAFKMAKDVMMKNLLWPLRQAIMPMLQKMMNWVRDHRALFVKWGQTLVGIFRTIVIVVKEFIQILKRLWTSISGVLKSIFGNTVSSLEEVINIILFKLVAMAQFVTILVEPLLNWIAKIVEEYGPRLVKIFFDIVNALKDPAFRIIDKIGKFFKSLFEKNKSGHSLLTFFEKLSNLFKESSRVLLELIDSFLDKLLPELTNAMTPLTSIADSFGKIFDALFGSKEATKIWKSLFELLGGTVGTAIVIVLEAVAAAIGLIADGVNLLVDALKELGKLMPEAPEWAKDIWRDITKGDAFVIERALGIKKEPEPSVFSGVTPLGMYGGGTSELTINNLNLNVTEGNAETTGKNFMIGLWDEWKSKIDKERLEMGQ